MNVENDVAVVGDDPLTVDRRAAKTDQRARHETARHRNHFDRERIRTEHSTILVSSTMQTNGFAEAATIFSRVSAPPPPLMSRRCGSTSSAPST